MGRITGPHQERRVILPIDIHIEVPAVPFRELSSAAGGTSSQQMREQVIAARKLQQDRFAGTKTRQNAQMGSRQIRTFCSLTDECQNILKANVNELGLSARAHDKVLRLSRTIADLDGSGEIHADHINEAVNYRMLDRNLWK